MHKSPMAAINELCMQKNVKPHYEVLRCNEMKQYECRLTFSASALDDIVGIGKCRIKRNAKQIAAYEALKVYVTKSKDEQNGCLDLDHITAPDLMIENFVKVLKDLCEANMLPKPEYLTVGAEGTIVKTFTMQCKVSTLADEGKAQCKKLAKQKAASSMIQKILELQKSDTELAQEVKLDSTDENDIIKYWKLSEKRNGEEINRRTGRLYSKVSLSEYHDIALLEEDFFMIAYSVRETLEKRNDPTLDDPISLIEEIAKLSDTEIRFRQITSLNSYRRPASIVFVSLNVLTPVPLLVIADGINELNAKTKASRKMLDILESLVTCSLENGQRIPVQVSNL